MFDNVSKIESLLTELEHAPNAKADDALFEHIVHLRKLAVSNWDHAHPDHPETAEICELRDRITGIEQRALELAARAPTRSVKSIRLKLLLWMLDQHIPLEVDAQETTADRLIASVFEDLTALSNEEETENPSHLRAVLNAVKQIKHP